MAGVWRSLDLWNVWTFLRMCLWPFVTGIGRIISGRFNNNGTFTVKKANGGRVLCFCLDDRSYKLFLPRTGRKMEVLSATFGGEDVTKEIIPFLGPNRDFFASSHKKLTPGVLGMTEITIHRMGCEPKVFFQQDILR